VEGETIPTLLIPLERANLNYWTMHFILTTAETRLCLREVTGRCAIKILTKHAKTWNYDKNGGDILCYNCARRKRDHENHCVLMNGEFMKPIILPSTRVICRFKILTFKKKYIETYE
jgi:hypothetical protein